MSPRLFRALRTGVIVADLALTGAHLAARAILSGVVVGGVLAACALYEAGAIAVASVKARARCHCCGSAADAGPDRCATCAARERGAS